MRGECLAHQPFGGCQSAGYRPIGLGHGQQLGAIEQAGLQLANGLQAGIRVFRDSGDNWVGTRPVWNEHTYHVTNVREDLSIPTVEIANTQMSA